VIRAEIGDLQVDTTGREPVVDVRTQGVSVRENCTTKRAEYSGSAWGIWKIQVLTRRVRGPFQAHAERGHITIESAGSWVEASTNQGDIVVHMVPADMNGDLHMNLEAGAGNITVFLPQQIRASDEMIVAHPIFRAAQIFSDFPMFPVRSLQGIGANNFNSAARAQSLINGGGNKILLHTWQGRISIQKN
jgi:hypothetical protein